MHCPPFLCFLACSIYDITYLFFTFRNPYLNLELVPKIHNGPLRIRTARSIEGKYPPCCIHNKLQKVMQKYRFTILLQELILGSLFHTTVSLIIRQQLEFIPLIYCYQSYFFRR